MKVKATEVKDFMKSFMVKFWGERCPDFEAGCGLCQAWKAYDTIFEFAEEDDEIEVSDLSSILSKEGGS